jgi:hypothetical protein
MRKIAAPLLVCALLVSACASGGTDDETAQAPRVADDATCHWGGSMMWPPEPRTFDYCRDPSHERFF